MRLLLDENIPLRLAPKLTGHEVNTVAGLGWQGVTNGELLRRASGRFHCLITMDRGMEGHISPDKSVAIVLIRAPSNRLEDLLGQVPAVLAAVQVVRPGEQISVGID